MEDHDDLQGTLTIESSLLEMGYAALCISRGEEVLPRMETLGVYHDVFIQTPKGYVFGECTGQGILTAEKITMFRDSVLKLNGLLVSRNEKPILEARFITMLSRKDWGENIVSLMEETENEFRKTGITLTLIEPKRLIYDLISSSVIGMILLDNHILFVGPANWAIRYNASISRFVFGMASIDMEKFRKLPQSFMSREHWNERHKKLYTLYAKMTKESLPEWISWKFPANFGVTWKSSEQMACAILKSNFIRDENVVYVGDTGFITFRKLAKRSFYVANVIYSSESIGPDDTVEIDRRLAGLIEEFRNETKIEGDFVAYSRFFTDTVDFSHQNWAKSKFRMQDGEISYTEVHRGDDVLLETLNSGSLGFKTRGNHVVLSLTEGADTMTVVRGSLQWESSKEGTYPATLKF